ncbi:hypothetical protein [Persicobacter psychrovividus]|uniref:Uncharacterized protein n=1 Tax=Persicobacter psychrovividus TaxID=387638 RepID=A0ABN6LGZ3_9BACT|nr:hypothetical protein PEPS_46980 [Persicobacter psychrovividus]
MLVNLSARIGDERGRAQMVWVVVICKFFGRTATISSAVSTSWLNLTRRDLPRIPWGEEGTVFTEEFQVFDKAIKDQISFLAVVDLAVACSFLLIGIEPAIADLGDDALAFDVEGGVYLEDLMGKYDIKIKNPPSKSGYQKKSILCHFSSTK